jgi:hypothetical protein
VIAVGGTTLTLTEGVGTPQGLGAFQPLLPTAAIAPPSSPRAGVSASFSAAGSSDPYPGGSIAIYSWSWGDGTPSSSGVSPTHAFAAPGQYTVTLTVTDSYGLESASSSQVVQVSERSRQEIEEEAAVKKQTEEATKVEVGTAAQGTAAFRVEFTPTVPDARLTETSLSVSSSWIVRIVISCPPGENGCTGIVTLSTLAPIFSGARTKRLLTLARASFNVPEGSTRTLTLHLSARARGLLAGARALRAKALVLARDPAGATHSSQQLVTLRAPSRRRG